MQSFWLTHTTTRLTQDLNARRDSTRCTQCGDALELEHTKRLAQAERVLCSDCAYDTVPCTD